MSDNANLTKKEQQELRGAEARISRVEKLQQQLEEARAAASERTIQKIEDINAQSVKLADRILKIQEQIESTIVRKQALVARQDELIKAKFVLADEIAEYLTPADHERLHLDTPENVEDNSLLTTEQVEEIAESAHKDEAKDEETAKAFADTAAEVAAAGEAGIAEVEAELAEEADSGTAAALEEPAKRDLKAEMDADLAAAKTQVAAKATRSRAKAK